MPTANFETSSTLSELAPASIVSVVTDASNVASLPSSVLSSLRSTSL
eukprot:CAMPEP_0169400110 /NCGR_PEP_ID=MMETSP1017-20121227/53642_1 /TAXON_ID=342587 /ORGANISM="Karlodinium micrum, Strain CCMP2283" /LENGTH=46 /DNA_ID= /DNA_START= /DNA_END= /DNA_ORIENTATION=